MMSQCWLFFFFLISFLIKLNVVSKVIGYIQF